MYRNYFLLSFTGKKIMNPNKKYFLFLNKFQFVYLFDILRLKIKLFYTHYLLLTKSYTHFEN